MVSRKFFVVLAQSIFFLNTIAGDSNKTQYHHKPGVSWNTYSLNNLGEEEPRHTTNKFKVYLNLPHIIGKVYPTDF